MADTRALHARPLLDFNYTLHATEPPFRPRLQAPLPSAILCNVSPHGSVHNGEATHDARGERCVAAYERRYS